MSRRIFVLVSAVVALAGCSGDKPPVGPDPGEPSLSLVAGDAQVGLSGVPLPDSLVVRVSDELGRPVPGTTVTWLTNGGDDAVSPRTAVADENGLVMTLWTLGRAAGADSVEARLGADVVPFRAQAELARSGELYVGRKGYVEYRAGELPLVLSAPHGGTLKPTEIADRTYGTLGRDLETDLLALAISDAFQARWGARPHVIVSNLHRVKLDPNREIVEAAQGDPLSEQAWMEFQGYIDHAEERVEEAYGEGFYIDLHGHGHAIQRLEIGYLLSANDLAQTDQVLGGRSGKSSVRSLVAAQPERFVEFVRGARSPGTWFEAAGYPAVPSQVQRDPGGAPYFTGGYNTRRHGSVDGGPISGMQIEANWLGVRDTQANRAAFADAVALVVGQVLEEYYGYTPPGGG